MDLKKKYPWTEYLKVSVKDFQQWQHSGVEESFVFWSLNNRVINQKSYIDWAVEHYQIPFLEDAFFEQYLITKKQWEKIKDLTEWMPEMTPVAVWEDTVFVGCVKLPLLEEQKFEFKHHFVLTSSMALQTTWKFVKELSRVIREDHKADQSKLIKQTNSNNEDSHPKAKVQIQSPSQKTEQLSEKTPLTEKNKVLHETALTPNILPEKKHPLDNPSIHQPSVQSSVKEDSISGVKTESTELKINSEVLKMSEDLPVVEEERVADVDNSTFPGRSPNGEENNLIMGDFGSQASDKESIPPAKKEMAHDKEKSIVSDLSDEEEWSQAEITVSTTGVSQLVNREQHYDQLWKQMRTIFCTSMILRVKDDKVYRYVWSGLMKVKAKDKELADFKDHSLFKIIQKGHSYHGFVVDTPANKGFF